MKKYEVRTRKKKIDRYDRAEKPTFTWEIETPCGVIILQGSSHKPFMMQRAAENAAINYGHDALFDGASWDDLENSVTAARDARKAKSAKSAKPRKATAKPAAKKAKTAVMKPYVGRKQSWDR